MGNGLRSGARVRMQARVGERWSWTVVHLVIMGAANVDLEWGVGLGLRVCGEG